MGLVRTKITLKNSIDVGKAIEGSLKENEIRQVTVEALVDTGAWTIVINEAVREKLGLVATRTGHGRLANGKPEVCDLAGPIEVWWKDRVANCDAVILPDARNVLLGAIPLEAMDLTVNPLKEEVVGAHGDEALYLL